MKIEESKGGGVLPFRNFSQELIPEGWNEAVFAAVIDLGMQDTPWGEKHQIICCYETALIGDDEEPMVAIEFFNATLGAEEKPSNLRIRLEQWGQLDDFIGHGDPEKLVGTPIKIKIKHKKNKAGNMRARIVSADPGDGSVEKTWVPEMEAKS